MMNYEFSPVWLPLLLVLVAWELAWKGVALWRASRHDQLGWFVAILVINSLGILPIIYLLLHRARRPAGTVATP